MSEKNTRKILENLGELVQENQCESQESEHVFSRRYEDRKAKLLNSVGPETVKYHRYRFSRPAVAAVSLCAAVALAGSVYAAVKLLNTSVDYDADNSQITIANDLNSDTYIPPIEITPKYLPEGYEKWDDGKYSYGGEYGADGISMTDASLTKTEQFQDVSGCEEIPLEQSKLYLISREGYSYPYIALLSFEESGHTVMLYFSQDVSREELLKVCENIEIKEVPEQDPDHTYQAFAYESEMLEVEEVETLDVSVPKESIVSMQEPFRQLGNIGNPEQANIQVTVTNVNVKDKADKSLITENTVYDYEEVTENLGEDGSLPEYTLTADYWNPEEKKIESTTLGTYPVKYVEVEAVMENLGETDEPDVNAQPQYCSLVQDSDGGFKALMFEEDKLDSKEKEWRGCSRYPLNTDHFPFYFDSSAFPGDSHFFNTALKAGEKKTVRYGFAVPEHWLDNLYLAYGSCGEGDDVGTVYVKLDTENN